MFLKAVRGNRIVMWNGPIESSELGNELSRLLV